MCGNIMAAGKLTTLHKNFMRDMLVMDSLRGPHSCGLTVVPSQTNEDIRTLKKAMQVHDFLNLKSYDKVVSGDNKILIGHNRWASKGAINNNNAHPFTVGAITGQHNGTLRGQWRLPDYKDFAVDSENIIHSINKIGIEKTWPLVDGAAALMWWDASSKTVNFIRNKERPLFICYSETLEVMFAASEYHMLQAALWRNNIKYRKIEEVAPDTLYSFNIKPYVKNKKEVAVCTTKKLDAFFQKPYKATSKVVNLNGNVIDFYVERIEEVRRGYRIFHCLNNNDLSEKPYHIEDYGIGHVDLELGDSRKAPIVRVINGIKYLNSRKITNNSEFDDLKEEEEEFFMTKEMWARVKGKTCDWCDNLLQENDDVIETTEGQFFCSSCAEEDTVLPYVVNRK